jgi:hypothetical protein
VIIVIMVSSIAIERHSLFRDTGARGGISRTEIFYLSSQIMPLPPHHQSAITTSVVKEAEKKA